MWDYMAIGNSGPSVGDYYSSISSSRPDYGAIAIAALNSSNDNNGGGSYTHTYNGSQNNNSHGGGASHSNQSSSSDTDYNRIIGTNGNDKIKGTKGDDFIYGEGGLDKINGGKGDDIIYSGAWSGGKADVVKGGKGVDMFVLDEDSFAFLKDFKVNQDFIAIPEDADASWQYNSDLDRTDVWINGENAGFVKGSVNLTDTAIFY